jgi:long-subunit fatty acid transport protein
MNLAFQRANTDSLSYPDSVVHNKTNRYAVSWGGGASYRMGVNTVGAEFHWTRDLRISTISSEGPRRIEWDVRGGVERPFGKQMVGRAGYSYRIVDEDDFTAGNEYIANAFSVGLGYAPASASWNMELGYAIELRGEEYESTTDARGSRQQLALQFHWAF